MTTIDKTQFGPWALITGASSGIGREFARQIAASGINVVLVARREALLEELGRALANEFGVKSRTVVADLSQVDFLDHLAQLTDDLDIGLVVSNAGTPHPGAFLNIDRSELEKLLRAHRGNVSAVAKVLDRQWTVVQRWLRQHDLDADRYRV